MAYLWENAEWTFPLIENTFKEIEKIAVEELGLENVYRNEIEIISSEQMLDAYSSVGMPVMYQHWSFGKHFLKDKKMYDKGYQGLAYEIVINSDPCISYLMEENTMTMQALVMAHACVAGDTEYLSPTGWKRFDEYEGGLVGQYHENGKVTFVEPSEYIVREQKDFILIESDDINQAITDDHTVILADDSDDNNIVRMTGKQFVENTKPYWFIVGFNSSDFIYIPSDSVTTSRIESEDGKAYCFTVDTNMLLIRRDGKISVTGNCFGHNYFFKNNHLFKTWTDASAIIDYLAFAKNYISECEEKYGVKEVEHFLDACHALQSYGVNKYKKPSKLSMVKERERQKEREENQRLSVNALYDRLIKKTDGKTAEIFPREPEENLLYFCEKYSPDHPEWKREILRIVRKVAQYFSPQGNTKLMNEGAATLVHYKIMNRLHTKGLMNDGSMIEFLKSHTSVVFQPDFDDPRYSGINPYALGFAMMMDIERICEKPTEEDYKWFPDIAGKGNGMEVLRDAWANYRDESFIRQFLSPKIIRDFKLFRIKDNSRESEMKVAAIHNESGYSEIRDILANQYESNNFIPRIEVSKMDPKTRTLNLTYTPYRGRILNNPSLMLKHVKTIWGDYAVNLWDNKDNCIAVG